MLDDVDEENRVLLNVKDDPVSAVDPGFGLVLVGLDRLDPQPWRGGPFDQGDGRPVAGRRTMSTVGALLQAVEESLGFLRGLRPGRAAFREILFHSGNSRLHLRMMEPELIVGH